MDESRTKLIASVGIAVLAAASRTIMTEDKRTLKEFLRSLVLAAFVGSIVSLIVEAYMLSDAWRGAIIGTASFLANDILAILMALGKRFREEPFYVLNMLLRARGYQPIEPQKKD